MFSYNLNFDAIQEVSVQSSSFEAQYGRASGGIVNVVTKSGGNQFSGSADVRYATNAFSETGDFFDPKVTKTKTIDPTFTLGGPIFRDRLWFFTNYEHVITERQPSTTNAAILAENPSAPSRNFNGDNYGLKLTFTISPSVNGFLNYQNSTATIDGAENSVLTRPEAAQTVDQGGALIKGKINAVLGGDLFLEASGGRVGNFLKSQPQNGSIATSRWTNLATGVRYDGYNLYDDTDRPRTLGGLSATYFVSDFVGNHQLKVGADADRTAGDRTVYNTGTPSDPTFCPAGLTCGATFTFRNHLTLPRVPVQQVVTERQGLSPRTGTSYSGYVQDQWRPSSRLTFNLGVRIDNSQQENNSEQKVVDFTKVQPRFSAAYDPLGDGKNVVRASYGWFYDEPGLTLVRLLSSGAVTGITRTYNWSAAQQKWVFSRQTGGTVNSTGLIDPGIKPTYEEQINVAFERELFRNTRASATYVYKKGHDIYEDSCLDEECSDFWVSNQPGAAYGLPDVLKPLLLRLHLRDLPPLRARSGERQLRLLQEPGLDRLLGRSVRRGGLRPLPGELPERFRLSHERHPPRDQGLHGLSDPARRDRPRPELLLSQRHPVQRDPDRSELGSGLRGAARLQPHGGPPRPGRAAREGLQPPVPGPAAVAVVGSVFNVFNSEQPLTYGTTVEAAATLKKP